MAPRGFRMRRALLAAGVISVVRLGLFWGGLTLTAEYPDWRQIAGYAILMVNSIAELGVAHALAPNRQGRLLTAGLIVLTSAALGWWWGRPRFPEIGPMSGLTSENTGAGTRKR